MGVRYWKQRTRESFSLRETTVWDADDLATINPGFDDGWAVCKLTYEEGEDDYVEALAFVDTETLADAILAVATGQYIPPDFQEGVRY